MMAGLFWSNSKIFQKPRVKGQKKIVVFSTSWYLLHTHLWNTLSPQPNIRWTCGLWESSHKTFLSQTSYDLPSHDTGNPLTQKSISPQKHITQLLEKITCQTWPKLPVQKFDFPKPSPIDSPSAQVLQCQQCPPSSPQQGNPSGSAASTLWYLDDEKQIDNDCSGKIKEFWEWWWYVKYVVDLQKKTCTENGPSLF